jgi:nicotinate-nucleotide adenylyltransferase
VTGPGAGRAADGRQADELHGGSRHGGSRHGDSRDGGARRVGLFGGSFDPIHEGHLHAARAALDAFDLDRVVFVPAARSPYKPAGGTAAPEHRLAMVELAITGEPRFAASSLELERAGPSYTIDTVRAVLADPGLVGEAPGVAWHLILGDDNLRALDGWRAAEELVTLVQPVVVHRDGDARARIAELGAPHGRLSQRAVQRLEQGLVELPPVVVSSSELRAHGLDATLAFPEPVPQAVRDYARRHGLYGEGAS